MRLEIKRGSHSLLLVVHFEGEPRDNFTTADLTWAPTNDELDLIRESLEALASLKKRKS